MEPFPVPVSSEKEVLSPVFKEYSSLSKVILKLEIFDFATGIVRVVSVLSALTGVVLTLSLYAKFSTQ